MSKFCMQCEKQLDDEAERCIHCGAAQNNELPDKAVPKKKKTKLIIFGIAAAAAVGIAAAILYFFMAAETYKPPIKYYFQFLETGDTRYIDKFLPECVIENGQYDERKKNLLNIHKAFKNRNFQNFSYRILNKKEADAEDIRIRKDDLEDEVKASVDIERGYLVKVETNYTAGDEELSESMNFCVYKVDGKWCLLYLDYSNW